MLFGLILTTGVLALLAGAGIKWVTDARGSWHRISRRELIGGSVLNTLVVAPLVCWMGYCSAIDNRLTFQEQWNGYETGAVERVTTCTRDGPCWWDYDCDPYLVPVTYTVCSGSGNMRSCSTRIRMETRYHSCPYTTTEHAFIAQTSLGEFTYDRQRLPENPDAHRWRAGVAVPGHVIATAGVGAPSDWVALTKRLRAGLPAPVSVTKPYANYVLASERTVLKQASSDIVAWQQAKLLPDLRAPIQDYYTANKAYFVGRTPPNVPVWHDRVGRVNALAGHPLQADLRVVVLHDASGSIQPDRYLMALKGHWQQDSVFGVDAMPKNTLLLALGTRDGQRIAWARATTGMPLGNEGLLLALQRQLAGRALDPDSLFGTPVPVRAGEAPKLEGGTLIPTLFGQQSRDTRFQRVSMGGDDDRDGAGSGFLYLKGEIKPRPASRPWILLGGLFACTLVWVGLLMYHDGEALSAFSTWAASPHHTTLRYRS